MADVFRVRLAQEELVYLLRALSIPAIPGIRANDLGKLDADHQALAMAVADRTLQARGIVHRDSAEGRHMDGAMRGLLEACALPTYTVRLDMAQTPGRDSAFITFAESAVVVHSNSAPGVHQLMALHGTAAVIPQLDALLDLGTAPPGAGQRSQISAPSLAVLLSGTINDALSSLPSATAEGLVDVLGHLTLLSVWTLWRGVPLDEGDVGTTAWAVAQAPHGTYVLWQQTTSLPTIDVLPLATGEVQQSLRAFLHPALAVLAQ